MQVSTRVDTLRIVAADGDTIADFEVLQGTWSEEQYLRLTDSHNMLLEFTDGSLEVLPMPTDKHQAILLSLVLAFFPFINALGGKVLFAPLRLQIKPGRYREPDLMLLLNAEDPRRQNSYWLGADLVLEIVSPDNPERDTQVKRVEYAQAGIPEYWVVNPEDGVVTVLSLEAGQYVEHGVFRRGEKATSALLKGFGVEVSGVFDAR